MVYLETTYGPKLFTKAVFVWTGHQHTGWPTSFDQYVYNDNINGVLSYGHDDEAVQELTWFIPHGSVALTEATCPSSDDAIRRFKESYGDRLIVWINPKEGIPMLDQWAMSTYVVTPAALNFPPFEGETRSDFVEWATPLLSQIASGATTIPLLKQY